MEPSGAKSATLEIVSDVVCPWCYIGKARLASGLGLLNPGLAIEIRWRPFELNPGMPKEGMDRRAYCERKFGSVEYANQLYAQIAASAQADGLPMAVERIARTPNTRAAHCLIEYAHDEGCQDAVVDALFAAYFVEGRDIGDPAVLIDIGRGAGLAADAVAALVAEPATALAIETQERAAQQLGISGVPAFVYNGRLLFTGAQDPKTIALSLERAAARGL